MPNSWNVSQLTSVGLWTKLYEIVTFIRSTIFAEYIEMIWFKCKIPWSPTSTWLYSGSGSPSVNVVHILSPVSLLLMFSVSSPRIWCRKPKLQWKVISESKKHDVFILSCNSSGCLCFTTRLLCQLASVEDTMQLRVCVCVCLFSAPYYCTSGIIDKLWRWLISALSANKNNHVNVCECGSLASYVNPFCYRHPHAAVITFSLHSENWVEREKRF